MPFPSGFAVEMRGIDKTFPENGVRALNKVDFCLSYGKIHALLGENGAGKSTLMHILAGFLSADSGAVLVNGRQARFKSPHDALRHGIGMVRQRPELVSGLRVWEDCILGAECSPHGGAGLFYRRAGRERVRLLDEQWHFNLPLDVVTERLDAAQRQFAAVLALLLRGAQTLIFDEPTAVLGSFDSEKLFTLWQRLAASGKSVVLISHKLEETLELAGELTVLRQGRRQFYAPRAPFNTDEIVSEMFGDAADIFIPLSASQTGFGGAAGAGTEKAAFFDRKGGDCGQSAPAEGGSVSPVLGLERGGRLPPLEEYALFVRGLSVNEAGFPLLRSLDFEVARGEILGVAGVKESGAQTLELALAGFLRRRVTGQVMLGGTDITGRGPDFFRKNGGAYLGAGRRHIGGGKFIVSQDAALSLRENLLIHAHRRLSRGGVGGRLSFMDRCRTRDFLSAVLRNADITRRLSQRLGSLSGGMGQRLLGMRELAEDPVLLIFTEPAWGLDRQRRTRFFRFLRECAAAGRGILIFFSDIEEIFGAADRIMVLRGGERAQILRLGGAGSDTAYIVKQVKAAMTGA